MKTIRLAITALGILAAVPLSAEEQRINIGVGELTCPTCTYTVATAMRGVPSVEVIDFTEGEEFGTGTYVVIFDDEVADQTMIVDAIRDIGYPADILVSGES